MSIWEYGNIFALHFILPAIFPFEFISHFLKSFWKEGKKSEKLLFWFVSHDIFNEQSKKLAQ